MKKKRREAAVIIVVAIVFFALSIICLIKEEGRVSLTERRDLAQFPKLNAESLLTGTFMEEFETYARDQFPFRDDFRSLKAVTALGIFGKKDNNDIYYVQGHLSRLDYPLNPAQQDYALKKMEYIYRTWLEGSSGRLFLAIIPDKNYYLAGTDYPVMDYEALFSYIQEQASYLSPIDLVDCLDEEDYYYTDTHWRQERILPVAERLAAAMGVTWEAEYEENRIEQPFYGVYAGQSGLPVEPDTIVYLTNDVLKNCRVISYDTGKPEEKAIYDEEKLSGEDLYEFFLSGAEALMTIENPQADENRELIVFRDSFGSSLIPLLVPAYAKITVVDTRYINSSLLGEFITFEDQDVLFLYSTMLLNNSMGMK